MTGFHDLFDIVSAVGAVGWLIVGLLLRSTAAEIKLIVLGVKSIIDTHVATDDVKHAAIERHLEFNDGRIERLEQRGKA